VPGQAFIVHTVPATVHGRSLLQAPAEMPGRFLLVGFHGYGESAEQHLVALDGIPWIREGWVCAVQALHPFYDRKMEHVVASWMTRLDRERAIADNREYVRSVIAKVREDQGIDRPLILAGFSQGAAMAFRAAMDERIPCVGVIALAGDLPPDVKERDLSRMPPVLLGRGKSDRLIPARRFEEDLEALHAAGVDVRPCVFKGRHEWAKAFCREAALFIDEAAS
jgi:predicted esterase